MLSDQLLRKYFRIFIVIVCILVLVMGFFWLNYLYGRHQRSLEEFTAEIQSIIETEVEQKAGLLQARGDSIYEQERHELESSLLNRAALVKSTLYDVYVTHLDDPTTFVNSLAQMIKEPNEVTDFSVFILSESGEMIGDAPKGYETLETTGINYIDRHMIYFEDPPYLGVKIYIYVDYDDYVKEQMKKNLITYGELDPQIYIRDDKGLELLQIQPKENRKDGFFYEKTSDLSGFTFGYYNSKDELDRRVNDRKAMFNSFLQSHIWEVLAFLAIFVLTSVVILRLIISNMGDYYQSLNEGVMDAYRNRKRLSDQHQFQHFALGDSIDYVIRESYLREEDYEKQINELKEQLKKNKLQRLLLEKKLLRLSDLPYTKDILYNYTMEEFDPGELIEKTHEKVDPVAPLTLKGSKKTLTNDRGLFIELLEEIFALSREEGRSYEVDIHQEGSQLLLYFTLFTPGFVKEREMQELKNRARLLGGVFLRHQIDDHLYLVLSLNDA